MTALVDFLWAFVWLSAIVAAVFVFVVFCYAAIDYVHEKIYGRPWLPETDRRGRNAR